MSRLSSGDNIGGGDDDGDDDSTSSLPVIAIDNVRSLVPPEMIHLSQQPIDGLQIGGPSFFLDLDETDPLLLFPGSSHHDESNKNQDRQEMECQGDDNHDEKHPPSSQGTSMGGMSSTIDSDSDDLMEEIGERAIPRNECRKRPRDHSDSDGCAVVSSPATTNDSFEVIDLVDEDDEWSDHDSLALRQKEASLEPRSAPITHVATPKVAAAGGVAALPPMLENQGSATHQPKPPPATYNDSPAENLHVTSCKTDPVQSRSRSRASSIREDVYKPEAQVRMTPRLNSLATRDSHTAQVQHRVDEDGNAAAVLAADHQRQSCFQVEVIKSLNSNSLTDTEMELPGDFVVVDTANISHPPNKECPPPNATSIEPLSHSIARSPNSKPLPINAEHRERRIRFQLNNKTNCAGKVGAEDTTSPSETLHQRSKEQSLLRRLAGRIEKQSADQEDKDRGDSKRHSGRDKQILVDHSARAHESCAPEGMDIGDGHPKQVSKTSVDNPVLVVTKKIPSFLPDDRREFISVDILEREVASFKEEARSSGMNLQGFEANICQVEGDVGTSTLTVRGRRNTITEFFTQMNKLGHKIIQNHHESHRISNGEKHDTAVDTSKSIEADSSDAIQKDDGDPIPRNDRRKRRRNHSDSGGIAVGNAAAVLAADHQRQSCFQVEVIKSLNSNSLTDTEMELPVDFVVVDTANISHPPNKECPPPNATSIEPLSHSIARSPNSKPLPINAEHRERRIRFQLNNKTNCAGKVGAEDTTSPSEALHQRSKEQSLLRRLAGRIEKDWKASLASEFHRVSICSESKSTFVNGDQQNSLVHVHADQEDKDRSYSRRHSGHDEQISVDHSARAHESCAPEGMDIGDGHPKQVSETSVDNPVVVVTKKIPTFLPGQNRKEFISVDLLEMEVASFKEVARSSGMNIQGFEANICQEEGDVGISTLTVSGRRKTIRTFLRQMNKLGRKIIRSFNIFYLITNGKKLDVIVNTSQNIDATIYWGSYEGGAIIKVTERGQLARLIGDQITDYGAALVAVDGQSFANCEDYLKLMQGKEHAILTIYLHPEAELSHIDEAFIVKDVVPLTLMSNSMGNEVDLAYKSCNVPNGSANLSDTSEILITRFETEKNSEGHVTMLHNYALERELSLQRKSLESNAKMRANDHIPRKSSIQKSIPDSRCTNKVNARPENALVAKTARSIGEINRSLHQGEDTTLVEFIVPFDTSLPLGMYLVTEQLGSAQSCIVHSVFHNGQASKDSRIKKGSIVKAIEITEKSALWPISTHEELKKRYCAMRKNSSCSLVFVNQARLHEKEFPGSWSDDGHWHGMSTVGWNGLVCPTVNLAVNHLECQIPEKGSSMIRGKPCRPVQRVRFAEKLCHSLIYDPASPGLQQSLHYDSQAPKSACRQSLTAKTVVASRPNFPSLNDAVMYGTVHDVIAQLSGVDYPPTVQDSNVLLKTREFTRDKQMNLIDQDDKDIILKIFLAAHNALEIAQSIKSWENFEISILGIQDLELDGSDINLTDQQLVVFGRASVVEYGQWTGSSPAPSKSLGDLPDMPLESALTYEPPIVHTLTFNHAYSPSMKRSLDVSLWVRDPFSGREMKLGHLSVTLSKIRERCASSQPLKPLDYAFKSTSFLKSATLQLSVRRWPVPSSYIEKKRKEGIKRLGDVIEWVKCFNNSRSEKDYLLAAKMKILGKASLLHCSILLWHPETVDVLLKMGADPKENCTLGSAESLAKKMADGVAFSKLFLDDDPQRHTNSISYSLQIHQCREQIVSLIHQWCCKNYPIL